MKPLARYILAAFLLLSVAGAWIGMVHDGQTTPSQAGCADVQETVRQIGSQATGSATIAARRFGLTQMSHMILNNASCFDASTVAAAQTALDPS